MRTIKKLVLILIFGTMSVSAIAAPFAEISGEEYDTDAFAPSESRIKGARKKARKEKQEFDEAAYYRNSVLSRFTITAENKALDELAPECANADATKEEIDSFIAWWRNRARNYVEEVSANGATQTSQFEQQFLSKWNEITIENGQAVIVARSDIRKWKKLGCVQNTFDGDIFYLLPIPGAFAGDKINVMFMNGLPIPHPVQLIQPKEAFLNLLQQALDQEIIKFSLADYEAEFRDRLQRFRSGNEIAKEEALAFYQTPYWGSTEAPD